LSESEPKKIPPGEEDVDVWGELLLKKPEEEEGGGPKRKGVMGLNLCGGKRVTEKLGGRHRHECQVQEEKAGEGKEGKLERTHGKFRDNHVARKEM